MGRFHLARAAGPRSALAAACFAVGLCNHAVAGTTTVSGDLAVDSLWEGRVEVTGEVRVAKGATLLVQPGTVIRFAPGQDEAGQFKARLFVSGTLVAQGTAESPITFESAAQIPQPGDWGGIVLEKANERPSRINWAIIRHGAVGIAGTYSTLLAEDVTIRDCSRGISALQEFKGYLSRGTLSGNGSGIYFFQNSGFQLEGCDISKNHGGGVQCILNSSPVIRFSTIADNGEIGIACIQGASPWIEGNTIRGHRKGIYLELQARPHIVRNTIRENETGIWGVKLVFPVIEGNVIADNGMGIYCNFSAYPVIHGNHILGNRTFGLVLGDNMSILMEKRIPFRSMGQFSFSPPPESEQPLPKLTKRFDPLPVDAEGIIDARGNWWGKAAADEMAKLGPDGNSSVIEDFFDKPDTLFGAETFRRDRVSFTPWESAPLVGVGPPSPTWSGVRGKVVSGGKPVAGVRVHAYETAAGNFRGEGLSYSSPTAADGSFSLFLEAGAWYLIAKAPLPPFPDAEPGADALFGYYGGNPVTLGSTSTASVNIQVVRRKLPDTTRGPAGDKRTLDGIVLGPEGPVAGAAVHVYTDASRQFRGPDLFGPQGAVVGGTDDKGAFSVELPAGSYYLVASRRKAGDLLGPLQPGDLHGWYDGNPVTIAPESRLSVTIQAVAKLRDAVPDTAPMSADSGITGIRGTLRDTAGKIPVGVYAFATPDPSFMIGAMPPHRSAPVGADGIFFIEIPAAGTFYVSARSGYGGPPLPGEWHGFHGEGKPAPVVVEANRITEGVTVVLKRME